MFRNRRTEALSVLLACTAIVTGVAARQAAKTTETKEPSKVVQGRVLARRAGLRDAVGNFDGLRRETFLFGVESKETSMQPLRPIKVVYKFYRRQPTLPESFFDYSVRYQLQAVRDSSCDETLDSLSYEEAADESGKPLGRDYVLRPLEGAPKELLKPDSLLPCYVLRPGNYKPLRRARNAAL